MKETRIFVTINRSANLLVLDPVKGFFSESTLKDFDDDAAEREFREGEEPRFFNNIQDGDVRSTVVLPGINRN